MKKTSKRQVVKRIKIIVAVLAIGICLLSGALLAITRASELPAECRSWAALLKTDDCDRSLARKVPQAQNEFCYDNFDYVRCTELAKTVRTYKLTALTSGLVAGVALVLIANKRPNKSRRKDT